jgi:hypothetical protein
VNPFSAIGPLADEQLSGARQRRFAHLRDEMTERLAGLAPPIDSVVRMLAPRSVVSLVRSNVASYVN